MYTADLQYGRKSWAEDSMYSALMFAYAHSAFLSVAVSQSRLITVDKGGGFHDEYPALAELSTARGGYCR